MSLKIIVVQDCTNMLQEDVIYLKKDLEKCKMKFMISNIDLYHKAFKNLTNYEPPPIERENEDDPAAGEGAAAQ